MRPVMEPLSREFIDSCRREEGRIIRGDNMTRIETFVDAAFAFAFTMLVISDEIPKSPPELFEFSKDIPAFAFSALSIGAVWLAHAKWSRTFGLQDSITVYLSLALVILMLVFVYPIKLMMQASVLYISRTIFDTQVLDTGLFDEIGWADGTVAGLFVYVAVGLMSLGAIIVAFYQNALRYAKELHITEFERDYCHKITLAWSLVIATAMLSLVVALVSDEEIVSGAGLLYFSLSVTIPVGQSLYRRSRFAVSPLGFEISGE